MKIVKAAEKVVRYSEIKNKFYENALASGALAVSKLRGHSRKMGISKMSEN
jgi:hypothetical protein